MECSLDENIRLFHLEIIPSNKYLDTIDQFDMVRDIYDRHVLAAAVASKCELIITGDKDLLVLDSCRDVRILTSKGTKRYA